MKNSILIRPILLIIDVLVIGFVVYFISDKEYFNSIFLSYIIFSWLIISFYTKYYKVYRYTHFTKLITLLTSQIFIFSLAYLSYFSIFREGVVVNNQLVVFTTVISITSFFKFFSFILLKRYRSQGKNYRNIVVFGNKTTAKKIEKLFEEKQDLGYHFYGFFSENKSKDEKYLGQLNDGLKYILKNNIDELYCELSHVTKEKLAEIRAFINQNNVELRIIPENMAIYSKDFILEYYGTLPILKPKVLPFERIETHIIKRVFDVLFSLFVSVFILSWLLPILWIAIKLDSKGPVFFKQKRDGINGKQFYCYKLRSMKKNAAADKISASKNDKRITKIGAFLRKTSLDELPQFFNVLLGEMSVVGPRPHMNIQTKKYEKEIDNYLIRNSVKPGISGLAQVAGYRGEVQKKSDIENRVRLDIFYIENWSFFLDIKIVIQTFLTLFKNDEKAY